LKSIRTSLTPNEIQLLDFITSTLLRGGDARMATRHREFASVVRKIQALKIAAAEAEDEAD